MAASDRFNIVVKGRQTHGSRPWGGVDPIVAAADIIGTAQTIVSRRQNISKQPVVVSFGAIKGGLRFNIIPDEVELVGTIRTFDEGMRAQVFADLKNVAESVAKAHGATVIAQVPDTKGNPVTVNHPALTARVVPSLETAVGRDNVVEMDLTMGAEDFSLFALLLLRRRHAQGPGPGEGPIQPLARVLPRRGGAEGRHPRDAAGLPRLPPHRRVTPPPVGGTSVPMLLGEGHRD
jgi:amidohydrolase